MINGIDPKTRAKERYWQRKARTNEVIIIGIKTLAAVMLTAVAIAVIL